MEQRNPVLYVAGGAAVLLIGWAIWSQFKGPKFEGMPAEIGKLTSANTICVGRVQELRKWASPEQASKAKTLYETAQGRVNGCITTIDLGLGEGFDAATIQNLRDELKSADQACASFVAYCDQNTPKQWGGSAQALPAWVEKPLEAIPNGLGKLYDDFRQQSEKEKKRIREALKAALFPDWDRIQNASA
jgi:hypothetical protein